MLFLLLRHMVIFIIINLIMPTFTIRFMQPIEYRSIGVKV